MKKLIGMLTLSTWLILSACTADKNTDNANEKQHSEGETEVSSEHNHDNSEKIVLIDGKKWIVDANMMTFIRNMDNAIKNFSRTNSKANLDAYKGLSSILDENVEKLTSNCTMTGQAHDELHKWLIPYIELTEKLNEATHTDDAGNVFADLTSSFTEFNTYFE